MAEEDKYGDSESSSLLNGGQQRSKSRLTYTYSDCEYIISDAVRSSSRSPNGDPSHEKLVALGSGDRSRGRRKTDVSSLMRLLGAGTCVTLLIATWTTQAEVLQGLTNCYHKPYFLTFWTHCFYTIFYVMWVVWRTFPCNFSFNKAGDGDFTNRPLFSFKAFLLSWIIMAADYLWYLSLDYTNVSVNMAINQSVSVITFVLSVILLRERVSAIKVVSVLVSVGGVFVITFATLEANNKQNHGNETTPTTPTDGNCNDLPERSTLGGYIVLVVSVFFYALYGVLYKKYATTESDPASIPNSFRFLGLVGIHTMLFHWMPLVVLHYSHLEPFDWPPSMDIYGMMYANMALGISFTLLQFLIISIISPLFMNIGVVLTVPASVVADYFVHNALLPAVSYVGMALILVGFFCLVTSEVIRGYRKERDRKMEEALLLQEEEEEDGDNRAGASTETSYAINSTASDHGGSYSPVVATRSNSRFNWRKIFFKYLI